LASVGICFGAALKTLDLAENQFPLDISVGVLIYAEDAGLKGPGATFKPWSWAGAALPAAAGAAST